MIEDPKSPFCLLASLVTVFITTRNKCILLICTQNTKDSKRSINATIPNVTCKVFSHLLMNRSIKLELAVYVKPLNNELAKLADDGVGELGVAGKA